MDTFFIHHTPLAQKTNREITLAQVDKVYIGKGNSCRCGCGGEYYTPEDNPKKVINALEKLASGRYEVESQDGYIFEAETHYCEGDTKVICLYLKK